MNYEVKAADGTCLYRGTDLELACGIHDQEHGAHLRLLPAPVRTCLPIRRPRAASRTTTTLGRTR